MHQGHRAAARGNRRLQDRHTRLDRKYLMSRSIDAARGAAGMNRFAVRKPRSRIRCGTEG